MISLVAWEEWKCRNSRLSREGPWRRWHASLEQKMPSIWTIVVNIYVSRKIRFVADLSEQIRECHYKLYQVILRDVTNLWREGKSWARWPLQFKSPHIVECQLNRLLSFHLSFYHISSLLRTSSVLKSFIFRALYILNPFPLLLLFIRLYMNQLVIFKYAYL